MNALLTVSDARALLDDGGVIAYPTEAVYGLGCDAWNEHAVLRILALKQRPVEKGLILLIHQWEDLFPLIQEISDDALDLVKATWPGPVTWVFPKSSEVPDFLSGAHPGIAIRMSKHPVAHALCQHGPIISTSANRAGEPPFRDVDALWTEFYAGGLDGIVEGSLGGLLTPTVILDVLTQQKWRE